MTNLIRVKRAIKRYKENNPKSLCPSDDEIVALLEEESRLMDAEMWKWDLDRLEKTPIENRFYYK